MTACVPIRKDSLIAWVVIFSLLLLAAPAGNAELATNFLARLKPVPPFPSVRAIAQADRIPLDGFTTDAAAENLSPNDSVTMLITLHEKGQRTQWLLYLQVTNDIAKTVRKSAEPLTLYTSTGKRFEFTNTPAVINERTIGPFSEGSFRGKQTAGGDKSARIEVNEGFLGLGLDRGTAALYRFMELRQRHPELKKSDFSISAKPFTSSQISRGRTMAAALQITLDEEQGLAGGMPALFSYFDTVQKTPELDSIMFRTISLPSVWSMVKHCGIKPDFEIGEQMDRLGPLALPGWGMPLTNQLYSLPIRITLNDQPALLLSMMVTAPQSPFLACGGIVGFLAENPQAAENYLTLQVVSARCQTR